MVTPAGVTPAPEGVVDSAASNTSPATTPAGVVTARDRTPAVAPRVLALRKPTPRTERDAVSVAVEYAVVPPVLVELSAVPPEVPVARSQARKVRVEVPTNVASVG
jgi:hypothetical protein